MDPITVSEALKNLRTNMLDGELARDWQEPRSALPGLNYLNPLRIGLSLFFAMIVVAILVLDTFQVANAYFSGEGFDMPATEFLGPALFFLVAAYGAAGQLRRVMLAHSLRRQARKLVVIPEYKTDLSPVEVGVMLDAVSDDNEIKATIAQLVSKGAVQVDGVGANATLTPTGRIDGITLDEKVFLQALFSTADMVALADYSALRAAAKAMNDVAFERMMASGYVPLLSGLGKLNYLIVTALSYVGFFLALVLFFAIFSEEAWTVNYPRYPVYLWQVLLVSTEIAVVVIVPLQAYFTNIFTRDGLEKYREAAGLYMFMNTVYRERVKAGALSQSELDYYLPYAYAFGFEEPAIVTNT